MKWNHFEGIHSSFNFSLVSEWRPHVSCSVWWWFKGRDAGKLLELCSETHRVRASARKRGAKPAALSQPQSAGLRWQPSEEQWTKCITTTGSNQPRTYRQKNNQLLVLDLWQIWLLSKVFLRLWDHLYEIWVGKPKYPAGKPNWRVIQEVSCWIRSPYSHLLSLPQRSNNAQKRLELFKLIISYLRAL